MRPKTIFLVLIIAAPLFIFAFINNRIDKLHTLTLNDPLFFTPGIHSVDLRKEVQTLTEAQNSTKRIIDRLLSEKTLTNKEEELAVLELIVHGSILPASYLQTLPDTINATENFLESPSFRNALTLNNAQKETALAYRKNADDLFSLVQQANNALSGIPFSARVMGSEVSAKQILKDLELLVLNSNAMLSEVNERSKCLFGLTCPKPSTYTPKYIPAVPTAQKEQGLLPNEVMMMGYGDYSQKGPYLVYSSCFGDLYTPMYILRDESRTIIKHAHENYYTDYSYQHEKNPSDPYTKKYIDAGFQSHVAPEGNDYRCPDLEYWGEITTIDHLQTLGFTEISSSHDLNIFYRENKELGRDTELLRIIENKMVALPSFVQTIRSNLELYNMILKSYRTYVSPFYLLATRSNYSITYGTFSRSIWRIKERPRYQTKRNLPLPDHYQTYTELKKTYTNEEIEKFHFTSKKFLGRD